MSTKVQIVVSNAVATHTAPGGPAAGQGRRRILIVEDNQFVARQCQSVLTNAGCEIVDIVTTADDAVRVALDRRPQLILMDIYLPGRRDGIDAAIEIFARCGIRSIFASEPTDSAAKARAETAKPLAWLPKPFSEKKLLTTVESSILKVEGAAYRLSTLESINTVPEQPGPTGADAEFPNILAEIAALKNPAPALAALALTEVWRGLVIGEGPSICGRGHFSRTIDAADAALCEVILTAAGGKDGAPVSLQEADILIEIYETALERKDGGRFDDLFIKAIAHHLVAAQGGLVPPRSVALARETPVRSWASPADLETVEERIATWKTGHRAARRLCHVTTDPRPGAMPRGASIVSVVNLAA